jgi:hypothetical protein
VFESGAVGVVEIDVDCSFLDFLFSVLVGECPGFDLVVFVLYFLLEVLADKGED